MMRRTLSIRKFNYLAHALGTLSLTLSVSGVARGQGGSQPTLPSQNGAPPFAAAVSPTASAESKTTEVDASTVVAQSLPSAESDDLVAPPEQAGSTLPQNEAAPQREPAPSSGPLLAANDTDSEDTNLRSKLVDDITMSYEEWYRRTIENAHKPFEFHGYGRAGFGVNHKGGDMDTFRAPGRGGPERWRLGNENDNYIEAVFVNNWLNPNRDKDKAWFRTLLTFSLITGQNNNFDETIVTVREMYAQAGNLFDSAPSLKFWAGQRFYRRMDIFLLDFFFLTNSGYGGGVEDLDLGFGKFHLAYLGGSSDDAIVGGPPSASQQQLVSPKIGRPTKSGFDARISDVKMLLGTMMFWVWGVHNSRSGSGPNEREPINGIAGGVFHTSQVLGGRNRLSFQYGTGPASNFDTFGVSSQQEDAFQLRVTETFETMISSRLGVMTAGVYERRESGDEGPRSGNRTWATGGFRLIYYPHEHINIGFEAAVTRGEVEGGPDGNLYKLALAPAIVTASNFWARPEIKLFVAAWFWDGELGDYVSDDKIDIYYPQQFRKRDFAINFGIQMESWW